MTRGRTRDRRPERLDSEAAAQIEAVMAAARVLVAVSARSVAEMEEAVTLPQLRVLVMVESRGQLNLGAVAHGLGVHPSNATRACDRLVDAGLLTREDDPADRRNIVLTLTARGRQVVDKVMELRRSAIADVLTQMPADRRAELVPTLTAFATAADEVDHVDDADVWTLGWTTGASPAPLS